jgi:ABC-type polysaccharide/polyol phosphate export permease
MRGSRKLRVVMSESRKILLIYDFTQKIAGNQAFFHRLLPYFQVFSPVVIGYIVFGNMLEQTTGVIPFRIWVCTGAIVWLFFLCVLMAGSKIFSNKTRRGRFLLCGPTFWTQVNAFFPAYFFMVVLLGVYLFQSIFRTQNLVMASSKLLITALLIMFSIPVLQTSIVLIGICTAFFRDFRILIPFIAQALLFTSPIFFESQIADTLLEKFIVAVNPLTPILDFFRNFIFADRFTFDFQILTFLGLSVFCYVLNKRILVDFTMLVIKNLNSRMEILQEAEN